MFKQYILDDSTVPSIQLQIVKYKWTCTSKQTEFQSKYNSNIRDLTGRTEIYSQPNMSILKIINRYN
jgi:hypothetical protein